MQVQKKTLDKIEEILSNHGIQVSTKLEKSTKQVDEKPKKTPKSPRYSEHLVPEYDI